jgi:hypothetical protein
MHRAELAKTLLECIRDVQEMCGKRPTTLSLDTCPFYDLDGFDSLTAVEATELLAQRIQSEIRCGKGDVNVFVSKDSGKPLKLSHVLDRLETLIKK